MHGDRVCDNARPRMHMNSLFTASPVLAWFFVAVWGSGYIASKTGLQYAPPFTFLTLRFAARHRCWRHSDRSGAP